MQQYIFWLRPPKSMFLWEISPPITLKFKETLEMNKCDLPYFGKSHWQSKKANASQLQILTSTFTVDCKNQYNVY
jgi:hypothetical protein